MGCILTRVWAILVVEETREQKESDIILWIPPLRRGQNHCQTGTRLKLAPRIHSHKPSVAVLCSTSETAMFLALLSLKRVNIKTDVLNVLFLCSDSGDSLFLTQQEAQPVRTGRRRRPEENAVNPFATGEVDCEIGESGSPARGWGTLTKPRRSRKFTPLRRRRHGHKRLSRRKSLICEVRIEEFYFFGIVLNKFNKRVLWVALYYIIAAI